MSSLACIDCDAPLPPREGPGRPALYCGRCRKKRKHAKDTRRAKERYRTDPEFRERRLAAKRKGRR